MRRCAWHILGLAIVVAVGSSTADASTRHHRRHLAMHAPRVVYSEPQATSYGSQTGEFAGAFETGIIGASAADPYER